MTYPAYLEELAASGGFARELSTGRVDVDRFLALSAAGGEVIPIESEGVRRFLVNSPAGAERVLEGRPDLYRQPDHPFTGLAGHLAPAGARMLQLGGDASRETSERSQRLLAEAVRAMTAAAVRASAGASDGFPVDLQIEVKKLFARLTARALLDVEAEDLVDTYIRALEFLEEAWARKRYLEPGETWLTGEERELYDAGLAIQACFAGEAVRRSGAETSGEAGEALCRSFADTVVNGFVGLSSALCWALVVLARHEEVADRLRREVDDRLAGASPEDPEPFRRLRFTRQVVSETLRLYPSAWILARRSEADDRIGDTLVPEGSRVVISPFTLHRSPDVWRDPERFDPSRFESDRIRARGRFAYLPFGRGSRRCPAGPSAVAQLQTVLALLVREADVSLADPEGVRPRGLISLRPAPRPRARFVARPVPA